MKEIKGSVFDFINDNETDSICITTNGIVNSHDLAIMGAGTAGEAVRRWPNVRKTLGFALKLRGNVPNIMGIIDKSGNFLEPTKEQLQDVKDKNYKCLVWSFPTKDDFRYNSIPELIKTSAMKMMRYADIFGLKKVIIPRPGCTNGKLKWEDVKPELEKILDDRFIIVSMELEENV